MEDQDTLSPFPYTLDQSQVLASLVDMVVAAMSAIANLIVLSYYVVKMRPEYGKRAGGSAEWIRGDYRSLLSKGYSQNQKPKGGELQDIIASTCIFSDMVAQSARLCVKTSLLFAGGPPKLTFVQCQSLAILSVVPWGGTILAYAQLALERYDALYTWRHQVEEETKRDKQGYLGMSRSSALKILAGGYAFSWSHLPIDIAYTLVTLSGILAAITAIVFSSVWITIGAAKDVDAGKFQLDIKKDPFAKHAPWDKRLAETRLATTWKRISATYIMQVFCWGPEVVAIFWEAYTGAPADPHYTQFSFIMIKLAAKKTRAFDDDDFKSSPKSTSAGPALPSPKSSKKSTGPAATAVVDLDDLVPRAKPKINAFALLNALGDGMDMDGDGDGDEDEDEEETQPPSKAAPGKSKSKPKSIESDDEPPVKHGVANGKSKSTKGRQANTDSDTDSDKPRSSHTNKKSPASTNAAATASKTRDGSDSDGDKGKRGGKKGGKPSKGKAQHSDDEVEDVKGWKKRGGKGNEEDVDEVEDSRGKKKKGKANDEEQVEDGKGRKKKGKKGHGEDEVDQVPEQPKKTAKQLLAEEEAAERAKAVAAESKKEKNASVAKKQGKDGKPQPPVPAAPEPASKTPSGASGSGPSVAEAEDDVTMSKKKNRRAGGPPHGNGVGADEEGAGHAVMITSRGKKIKGKWIPIKEERQAEESDEGSDRSEGADNENRDIDEDGASGDNDAAAALAAAATQEEDSGWRKADTKAQSRKMKEKLLSRSPVAASTFHAMMEQEGRRGRDPDEEEEEEDKSRRKGRKAKSATVDDEDPEITAAFAEAPKKKKGKKVVQEEEEEVEEPKKKQKNKKAVVEEEPVEEEPPEEEQLRSKKKKSKKAVVEEEPVEEEPPEEEQPKSKKKKSKKVVDEEPLDEEPQEEQEAKPKKKKSKKAIVEEEEPGPGESEALVEEEEKPKPKKKKSKKALEELEPEGEKEQETVLAAAGNTNEMELDSPANAAVNGAAAAAPVSEPAAPVKKSGKGKASWRQKVGEKGKGASEEKNVTNNRDGVDELIEKVSKVTLTDMNSSEIGTPSKAKAAPSAPPPKPAVSGVDLGMGLDGDEMESASRATKSTTGASKSVTVFDAPLRRTVGRGVQAEQQMDGTFASSTDHVTATGTLVSDDTSKDIIIDSFSLAAWGTTMIKDGTLKLVHGRKYGLLGVNGAGKSTLLRTLGNREVPIQNAIDIYLLDREFDPTDMTAVDAVVDIVVTEKEALEQELDELLDKDGGSEMPRFEAINDRINELDIGTAERRAKEVLHGLGFTPEMQLMKTREFSGGWRMRIALARALFVKPTLLLLDEPTNHLDLGACVWLEEYLKKYKSTVLLISHSQDFLNGICTDIIHLHNRKLDYYTGDYDTFVTVRSQKDATLSKKAKAAEKQLAKMQDTVARLGQKVAKQAKQKEKVMAKKTEKLEDVKDELFHEKAVSFRFNDCGGGLAPPVLQFREISFNYPGKSRVLFKDVTFGIDLESRVALVGPNGAGKSTLLKLMVGEVAPTSGAIVRHHHLRIARFHQHLTDQLNLSLSAVEYLCHSFKDEEDRPLYKEQAMRNIVGKFGLSGKSQVVPMAQLSDGQRRRVVFAWLALTTPHMLLLDEPTNHLDIETIDALADAINAFDGGVVLVSHDFRLIEQVAHEIWIVQDEKVETWEDDIRAYKEHLRDLLLEQMSKWKKKERGEKARILAEIREDKERRRQQQAKPPPTAQMTGGSPGSPISQIQPRDSAASGRQATIQLRLLDGTVSRHQFLATAPLSAIFALVEAQTGLPLIEFNLIQPFPHQIFSIHDARSIVEAGLTPSASLNVVRVVPPPASATQPLPTSSAALQPAPGAEEDSMDLEQARDDRASSDDSDDSEMEPEDYSKVSARGTPKVPLKYPFEDAVWSQVDSGIVALETLGNLQYLDLTSCRITDGAATSISRLPELVYLNLSSTKITNRGLRLIATGVAKLDSLIVSNCAGNTSITDEDLRKVVGCLVGLEELDVSECSGITLAGIRIVVQTLKRLHKFQFPTKGVDCDAVLREVARVPLKITELDLHMSNVTDDGLKSIGGLGESLTRISLAGCKDISDSGFLCLARLVNIEDVDLDRLPQIDEHVFADVLCQLPRVHSLSLSASNVGAYFLCKIEKAPFARLLRKLNLSRTAITDESLQYLHSFQKLSMINLDGSPHITMNALDILKGLELPELVPPRLKIAQQPAAPRAAPLGDRDEEMDM
ncbi:hypothetical protein HDU93_000957 [Gonapodya sp. JEL0774]|nr:hypothetical protein HDU93_000957 [Gonapodya sp. JEL0774]